MHLLCISSKANVTDNNSGGSAAKAILLDPHPTHKAPTMQRSNPQRGFCLPSKPPGNHFPK